MKCLHILLTTTCYASTPTAIIAHLTALLTVTPSSGTTTQLTTSFSAYFYYDRRLSERRPLSTAQMTFYFPACVAHVSYSVRAADEYLKKAKKVRNFQRTFQRTCDRRLFDWSCRICFNASSAASIAFARIMFIERLNSSCMP